MFSRDAKLPKRSKARETLEARRSAGVSIVLLGSFG